MSPNWANVESSQVLQDMLVKIFTGAGDGRGSYDRRIGADLYHAQRRLIGTRMMLDS